MALNQKKKVQTKTIINEDYCPDKAYFPAIKVLPINAVSPYVQTLTNLVARVKYSKVKQ